MTNSVRLESYKRIFYIIFIFIIKKQFRKINFLHLSTENLPQISFSYSPHTLLRNKLVTLICSTKEKILLKPQNYTAVRNINFTCYSFLKYS